MASPRVLILRAPGTNCDGEAAHAFELAGGAVERLHVNRVLERSALVEVYQIICLPGGFSYGDDVAAGRILGNQMQNHLSDVLEAFREAGKLILGICNGFQVLMKTELLVPHDGTGAAATLALNDSGKFEDRWVRLSANGAKCVFLAGIDEIELPVAHGEGKFVTRDEAILANLDRAGQLVLRYLPAARAKPQAVEAVGYPANPNGSIGDVAGICDATGRVFGLMPHPERFVDQTQHPTWTRGPARDVGEGLRVFQNAVQYFC